MANKLTQIGPRLTDEALKHLSLLQEFYAQRAGLTRPVSQSEAIQIALRDEAARATKLTKGGK